jgi:hypothetical protein
MLSFSPATSSYTGSLILVAFADHSSERSARATRALAAELDSILTSQNQTHRVRPLSALTKTTQGSAEFWLVGGGVVVGLLVPAIALRMLWKPFSRIGATGAMSEAVWTQGPV